MAQISEECLKVKLKMTSRTPTGSLTSCLHGTSKLISYARLTLLLLMFIQSLLPL